MQPADIRLFKNGGCLLQHGLFHRVANRGDLFKAEAFEQQHCHFPLGPGQLPVFKLLFQNQRQFVTSAADRGQRTPVRGALAAQLRLYGFQPGTARIVRLYQT